MRTLLFCVLLVACLFACSNDNNPVSNTGVSTLIYKYDGSVQCDHFSISVEEMRAELNLVGIAVLDSYKSSNGWVYPTVCGGGTGKINVFEVYSGALPEALDIGFKILPDEWADNGRVE